jgi:EpsI family protein
MSDIVKTPTVSATDPLTDDKLTASGGDDPVIGPVPLWRSIVLIALVVITIGVCLASPSSKTGALPGVEMALPHRVGEYWGYDKEVSPNELAILPKDTEFVRKLYESLIGDQIFCSIVLAGAQKQSIHRPEVCLPAQGWTIRNRSTEKVTLVNGKILDITVLTLVQPFQIPSGQTIEVRQIYTYWFIGRTRMTPSHFSRVFESMLDRVFSGISHRWAYVTVSSQVQANLRRDGKDETQTLELIKQFISQAAPSFIKPEAYGSTAR